MNYVRKIVHAERVYKMGMDGSGVTAVVMDTGAAPHPDFSNRILCFKDFVNKKESLYDDNGHGSHVLGILAGDGSVSRQKYENKQNRSKQYRSKEYRSKEYRSEQYGSDIYCGMAPGANLVVLKVLDKRGNGDTNLVLEAIDWIVANKEKYKIRILNISVGMLTTAGFSEQKALLTAVDMLWDEGIFVVAAAGNNGPVEGSVTIPGISRKILTVGSMDDDFREKSGSSILRRGYSGVGPTNCCIVKPEVLAPGTNIISCGLQNDYIEKSGTSMAAPVVSGVVALAFQKYRELTPAEMKLRIYESVYPRGSHMNKKCWGIIHADNLLRYE